MLKLNIYFCCFFSATAACSLAVHLSQLSVATRAGAYSAYFVIYERSV